MNRPNDRNANVTIGEVRDHVAMAMYEAGHYRTKLLTFAPVGAPYNDARHKFGVYIGGGESEAEQRAFYRALNLARMHLGLPLYTTTCEDCFVFNRPFCTHMVVVDAAPYRPDDEPDEEID